LRLTAKFLLTLASTVILGSESHGTHGLILLFDGSGSLQIKPKSVIFDWRFTAIQFVFEQSLLKLTTRDFPFFFSFTTKPLLL
jgi:hypothetical protein